MASSATARHILLTGPPGVGKTTLINKVCEVLNKQAVPTQGFYTAEVRAGGKRQGFDVVTLDGKQGPLARVSEDSGQIPGQGRRYMVGKYSVELASFEAVAIPTLRNKAGGDNPVYVIDEIGKMELFSQSFVREVKDVLGRPGTTVLATIPIAKGRPIPFVEEVRHRKDAILFTISVGNRNSIMEDIVGAVLESVKSYGR